MKKILLIIVLMCGCLLGAIAGDYNGDGRVDLLDFAELANNWCSASCPHYGIEKLETLARNWLMSTQYKYVVSGDLTPEEAEGDYYYDGIHNGIASFKNENDWYIYSNYSKTQTFIAPTKTEEGDLYWATAGILSFAEDVPSEIWDFVFPMSFDDGENVSGTALVSPALIPLVLQQSIGGRVRSRRGLGRLER